MRVVIAGGGTGGHVVPGLAIARELRDRHAAEIVFIGTARGVEARMVPEAGFRLELVRSGQLKNVSLGTRLKTLIDVPLGVLRCLKLLRAFQPDVIIGVGGYASGPAMVAALLLRVPTLVYEPNAAPGLTNRLLGKYVSAAAVNFAATTSFFRNAEVTGVPVRPEIFAIQPKPPGSDLRLLVTAGSNGALIFNRTLPQIIARLLDAFPALTVVHQSGPRRLHQTQADFLASGVDATRYIVTAFLEDMPAQYAAADLVLARAGSTVAELCAAGRASLLVPFAAAADDHQRRNADVLVAAGAAAMLLERDVTPDTLLAALMALLSNADRRAAMATAARSLGRHGALEAITAIALRLAQRSQHSPHHAEIKKG